MLTRPPVVSAWLPSFYGRNTSRQSNLHRAMRSNTKATTRRATGSATPIRPVVSLRNFLNFSIIYKGSRTVFCCSRRTLTGWVRLTAPTYTVLSARKQVSLLRFENSSADPNREPAAVVIDPTRRAHCRNLEARWLRFRRSHQPWASKYLKNRYARFAMELHGTSCRTTIMVICLYQLITRH